MTRIKSGESSNFIKVKKNKTDCVVTLLDVEGDGPNNEEVKVSEEPAVTAMSSEGAV